MELRVQDPALKDALGWICHRVAQAGGRTHVVGGSVRDALLGLPAQDLDLEVFALEPQALTHLLRERFELDLVGDAFGVVKIRHLALDVALPRRESKSGMGHRGFEVFSDPWLSTEEAAARRDFTINSMAYDPLQDTLVDPFGGWPDLKARVLRHTSDKFIEDPLRVLRGMQFVARFALEAAPETVELCRRIEPEGLARERIFEEWKKLLTKGREISQGLRFLRSVDWLRYYPELAALIDCPQEPEWHPEGDVWTHTLHVLDAFAEERCGEEWEDLVVGTAALCHDLGKPETTAFEEGRLRSRGHEAAGEAPTRSLLGRLTLQEKLVEEVVPLVIHHLKPRQLFADGAGDSAIRRLARKVKRIDRLVRLARADDRGRPPLPFHGFPAGEWLLERAQALDLAQQAPQPLVMGRHLVERGLDPGPHFRGYLDRCFEAQLDGRFTTLDGGLEYLNELFQRPLGDEEPGVSQEDRRRGGSASTAAVEGLK